MELLGHNTPQFCFESIHVLILAGISNNKTEPVKVNGYGVISANYEAENIFTFFALNLSHTHPKKMWNLTKIN